MWALMLLALAAAAGADCPRHCECKWRSGKESALCARAGLTAIPPRLPSTTQLLDLSDNKLNNLRDDIFSNAGLLNLQRLYLISCNIRTIKQSAFRALVNLVELDLSRNRIESIPSHAFAEIHELRELRLDGNPITRIRDEAFTSLPKLVRLSLRSCKIFEIEPRSFVGLEGSLEYLEVDKNKLQILHVAVLAPLRSLKGLELANNPWECTCALRPLRDWMIRRNVPATIVPECALPPRLMSQSWDKLDLDDFACSPDINVESKHKIGVEGDDVTLVCKVVGLPAGRVRWLRTGRLLANLTSNNVHTGRTFLMHSDGHTNNLTIKFVDMQDAGPYTCSAENRAGKAEALMTLTVQRRPPDKGLTSVVIGILAIIALVIVSAGLVMFFIHEAKKKRQIDRWNEQIVITNHRNENYEKIEMNLNKETAEEVRRGILTNDSNKKRGDYQNVPSHDPEEENQRYVTSGVISRQDIGLQNMTWKRNERNKSGVKWSIANETDLHIPRISNYKISADATPDSVPSSTSTGVLGSHPKHGVDDNGINNNPPRYHSKLSARDRFDNEHSGSDSEKNYPDLIEMSALGTASYLRNERKHDPYFYTIPRRKDTDSRSPLLDSRRNSSGGDSMLSVERNYEQRLKPTGRRSNSFLDLTSGNPRSRRNPSLPASPTRDRPTVPSATPLLDLSGLRDYSQRDQALEDYDFRASQLERFLEEYRSLREQLSKMKETRENLQKSRVVDSDELRSISKAKTSVAVTETSSLAALADAASPLTLSTGAHSRSDWMASIMYRN